MFNLQTAIYIDVPYTQYKWWQGLINLKLYWLDVSVTSMLTVSFSRNYRLWTILLASCIRPCFIFKNLYAISVVILCFFSWLHLYCSHSLLMFVFYNYFTASIHLCVNDFTAMFGVNSDSGLDIVQYLDKSTLVIHSVSPFGFAKFSWNWMRFRVQENVDAVNFFKCQEETHIGDFMTFLCGT